MCYILFIFFVCIKGTKLILDPKGLVLVHDNNVLYLLRYAPVSSFSDTPPPFSKWAAEWLKTLLPPSIKDLAINNALWSWGVIKQDD